MPKLGPGLSDRNFVIDCCKDGTLTVRRREQKPFNGVAIPVFLTKTKNRAESLVVAVAKAQYGYHPLLPGETWYRISDFTGELEDLNRVACMIELVDALRGPEL